RSYKRLKVSSILAKRSRDCEKRR
ncbi:hypothetical protein D039_2989B, partial [Vibrio parahaemolyticus EKP-028]